MYKLTCCAIILAIIILVIYVLVNCGICLLNQDSITKQYQTALTDAAKAEASERYDRLLALTPDNDYIYYVNDTVCDSVLVVTWTSYYKTYAGLQGKTLPIDWGNNVWVTVVPELYDFCKKLQLSDEDLTLRLEQLHGLPHHKWLDPNGEDLKEKTHFVEMWVSVDDIFRPCPDSSIRDNVCEIKFDSVIVSDPYYQWFLNERKKNFNEDRLKKSDFFGSINGYPWTQLGYTYDWGNPDTEIGLSEFVIKKNAVVRIHSVKRTTAYCK